MLDDKYPRRLKAIHQAPPVLFTRGRLLAEDPAVSVVGSRRASDRGRRIAAEISRALVSHNLTVIAGLATGIDSAAHRAALDAHGRTVAIIGTGINKYYPASIDSCRMRSLRRVSWFRSSGLTRHLRSTRS